MLFDIIPWFSKKKSPFTDELGIGSMHLFLEHGKSMQCIFEGLLYGRIGRQRIIQQARIHYLFIHLQ